MQALLLTHDKIYVTDRDNDRIQIFTSNGTFITAVGSQGSEEGQFNRPEGVGVDPYSNTGLVYVADTGKVASRFSNLKNNHFLMVYLYLTKYHLAY